MIDDLSIVVDAFDSRAMMAFSVDDTLLPSYVNSSTNFRESIFSVEMCPYFIKTHLLYFVCVDTKPIPPAASSRLRSWDSAWVVVLVRSAMSSLNSASVIFCAKYRLLLAFFSIKPFSFIRSKDIRST